MKPKWLMHLVYVANNHPIKILKGYGGNEHICFCCFIHAPSAEYLHAVVLRSHVHHQNYTANKIYTHIHSYAYYHKIIPLSNPFDLGSIKVHTLCTIRENIQTHTIMFFKRVCCLACTMHILYIARTL